MSSTYYITYKFFVQWAVSEKIIRVYVWPVQAKIKFA
jgi:hypothetical protein